MSTHCKMVKLREDLMIHSYLYYILGGQVVTDQEFDTWCAQLVELHDKVGKDICYNDDLFEDFNGSTGMGLTYKIPQALKDRAEALL